MMVEEPLTKSNVGVANLECTRLVPKMKTPMDERIFDVDGHWLRAAAICLRHPDSDDLGLKSGSRKERKESVARLEVLLVTSTAHPDRWIVPGGKLQAGEAPHMSAAREAMEEAGVSGSMGGCVGVFTNVERKHRTHVFQMRATNLESDYDDKERRQRAWFPIHEALHILIRDKPSHADYIQALLHSFDNHDT